MFPFKVKKRPDVFFQYPTVEEDGRRVSVSTRILNVVEAERVRVPSDSKMDE